MLSIAARIRRARTGARLTQERLAAVVGVRRSAVAQWESRKGTYPSTEHLAQVAVATDVHFEWLATGRGPYRLSDGVSDMGVVFRDFAQNELESKALELMRRFSDRKQRMVCSILELL